MVDMGDQQIRIGLVGYKFMGKAHSHAYRDLPFFFDLPAVPVMQAISGRDEDGVNAAADKLGWASHENDWRALIQRDDIDVIDIVTPNHSHAEIAIAALEAGKHVLCEKPLAINVDEAKRMLAAARKSGKVHMICHNYRFSPAVQFAKKLIREGRLGRIYHFRGLYLQDWLIDPDSPLEWRMRKEESGSGSHGDLASHMIDLARFLVGDIDEVVGTMETFIGARPLPEQEAPEKTTEMGEVDVDDASVFIARFKNGAIGTFEATRFAGGNRNGNRFEINGERGSIRWDLESMNVLEVYLKDDEPGLQGFRTITCTEMEHPYGNVYWAPGHNIGYEHTFLGLMREFLNGIATGRCPQPSFADGLQNQMVLEAVEKSSRSRQWVSVDG